MKALSVTQPWATLIVSGAKTIETRSWRTNCRDRIAIHAAKTFPRAAREFLAAERHAARYVGSTPTGCIVGMATVVGCVPVETLTALDAGIPESEARYGDFTEGRFAWLLADPVEFLHPIPCSGRLGLWTVKEPLAGVVLREIQRAGIEVR